MRSSMRRPVAAAVLAAAAFVAAQASSSARPAPREYVVLYKQGVTAAQGRHAVEAAGGQVVSANAKIGVATVRSGNRHFVAAAARQRALAGAAQDRPIGHVPHAPAWQPQWGIERGGPIARDSRGHWPRPAPAGRAAGRPAVGHADDRRHRRRVLPRAAGHHGRARRHHRHRHRRLASRHRAELRRRPEPQLHRRHPAHRRAVRRRSGPSCDDPANVDEDGHGTHVAGTIGSPLNGIGIARRRPEGRPRQPARRAGLGLLLPRADVDALTYAGDNGIDVVNMSFYIDPWLYNCRPTRPTRPTSRREQRTIIAATQRALDYAAQRGVTLVAADGQRDTDLGNPRRRHQPRLPAGRARLDPRTIDNSCLSRCRPRPRA